jgi:hypothetical protein
MLWRNKGAGGRRQLGFYIDPSVPRRVTGYQQEYDRHLMEQRIEELFGHPPTDRLGG